MTSEVGALISFFVSIIFLYGMVHYSYYLLKRTFDSHLWRSNAKFYIAVLAICMFVCIIAGLAFCGVIVN